MEDMKENRIISNISKVVSFKNINNIITDLKGTGRIILTP